MYQCSYTGYKSFLADGYTAVGLEGSDAPKRFRSGRSMIPNHLFSCDITEPFENPRRGR